MDWCKYHKYLKPQRLLLEQEAVKQEFPQFRLEQFSDGSLAWTGSFKTVFGNTYKVRVAYTRNYPYNEPEIYILEPKIRSSQMVRGEKRRLKLCRQTQNGLWRPDRATAVVTIRQAIEWIHLYDRARTKAIFSNKSLLR